MKTKIVCPRDRVEEVFGALMFREMTFEFHYRVECWFVVPHMPAKAMQLILKQTLPLSLTVEKCQFSEIP